MCFMLRNVLVFTLAVPFDWYYGGCFSLFLYCQYRQCSCKSLMNCSQAEFQDDLSSRWRGVEALTWAGFFSYTIHFSWPHSWSCDVDGGSDTQTGFAHTQRQAQRKRGKLFRTHVNIYLFWYRVNELFTWGKRCLANIYKRRQGARFCPRISEDLDSLWSLLSIFHTSTLGREYGPFVVHHLRLFTVPFGFPTPTWFTVGALVSLANMLSHLQPVHGLPTLSFCTE